MAHVRPDRWEQADRDRAAPAAPTPLTVRLDGSGHPLALVGGKGASLDRLVRLEFAVPPAAAVTTAAYRAFVDSSVWLQAFLSGVERRPLPGPEEAAAERQEIAATFLGVTAPPEVEDAVAALVEGAPASARFAVRSSATAEDLTAASFAGQHLSLLEVAPDDVFDAVRRVWASLWDPAARAYRSHMAVPSTGLAMAVIVQEMVPAARSGVAFTRDPLDARALRIESVHGLGEALVSGEATPEVVKVARPSLRVLESDAGAEFEAVVPAVVRAALRVEEELGSPQDVEWSVADGRVWVLQARPITTLAPPQPGGDGFDTVARAGDRYSPTGVSEMLPGVLAPLQWTVNGPLLEEAFRRVLARLGTLPPDLEGPFAVLGRFRGQAALNLSLLEDAARRVGGTDGSEVQRQYLGHVVDVPPPAPRTWGTRLRTLRAAHRSARLRRASLQEAAAFRRSAAAVIDVELPWADLRAAELLAARARVRDLAAAGVAAEVAVAVAAVGAYEALEATLRNWVDDDAARWAQRLTRHAAGEGALRPDPRASRAVYGGPTWAESEASLPDVPERRRADASERSRADLAELEGAVMRTRRWRFQRVITGQVVDLRRRALRRLVASACDLLAAREHTKADVLRLGGVERRLVRELARRLERRGVLGDAADVDLLADWELDRAVADGIVPSRQELTRRRRVVAEWQYRPPLPPLIDHRGEEMALAQRPGDALIGWGASPGRHRGRARVVTSSADAAALEPGDVLVAPATDPSWTPLFLVAGAIVVERGGPLSHAAIVARELGIPAVLNAVGATAAVADGALVEVDGDRGHVAVVEEVTP